MGKIRKVGDVYYIEFFARGLLYSQPGGGSHEEALRMLQEVEAKIAQGEALTIVREIELELFFEQYLIHTKSQFSPKSIERLTLTWNHWMNFLISNYPNLSKLSQITPSVVETYKMFLVKRVKPKVVNLTILLLREILEYGIKTGFINDNPSLHISLLELSPRVICQGRRKSLAQELLQKGVPLGKVYSLLKLKDIAQVMYWSNFIPIKREDVYN